MGKPFLANPDLVERLRNNWPLNEPDHATFYTAGPRGYIDYPVCEKTSGHGANRYPAANDASNASHRLTAAPARQQREGLNDDATIRPARGEGGRLRR